MNVSVLLYPAVRTYYFILPYAQNCSYSPGVIRPVHKNAALVLPYAQNINFSPVLKSRVDRIAGIVLHC